MTGRRVSEALTALALLGLLVAAGLEITDSRATIEVVAFTASGALLALAAATRDAGGWWRSWRLVIAAFGFVLAAAKVVAVTRTGVTALLLLPTLGGLVVAVVSARNVLAAEREALDQWRVARVEGEERERVRWARELHDETLQELGALQLLLAAAARSDASEAIQQTVADAGRLIDGQIAALRHMIGDLRPFALDQLGLEPALRSLCERTTTLAGLEVTCRVDPGDGRLPAAVEVACYRIAQEALRNAVKHAGAAGAHVAVHRADDQVVVTVVDDGCGFDVRAGGRAGGVGIAGMRERADLARGALTIESAPGAGTRVTARLPLRPPAPPRPRLTARLVGRLGHRAPRRVLGTALAED